MSMIDSLKMIYHNFMEYDANDKFFFIVGVALFVVVARFLRLQNRIELLVLSILGFIIVSFYYQEKTKELKEIPTSVLDIYKNPKLELSATHKEKMIQIMKRLRVFKKFNKPMYKSIALDLRDFYAAYQQAISLEPNTHYYIEIATDKRRVILNNLHSIIMSMPPTPNESLEIELEDIIQKIGDLLQNDINQLIKVNNQNSRKNPNINTKIIEEGPEAVNDVMYSANFNIY